MHVSDSQDQSSWWQMRLQLQPPGSTTGVGGEGQYIRTVQASAYVL